VTVGSPNLEHFLPTDNNHFFRNQLAEFLASQFDLDTGGFLEFGFWKTWDALSQSGGSMESGDFLNCANWGARTDDFLEGKNQIANCFPNGGSDKRTLIVFTMGGNDIAKITEKGAEASEEEVAAGYPEAWALGQSTADYLREAVEWLKDPERFPNGSYVLFANPYEFTDGTGEVTACPTAGLVGFTEWAQPEVQRDIVIELLEQYMQIAVDTQTDMVWLLEHFCGHGYVATGDQADVNNQCYLGPDTELYFDETCVHPNEAGHTAIYEMFKATVLE
jgi:lysophospholipase L1-like esterase